MSNPNMLKYSKNKGVSSDHQDFVPGVPNKWYLDISNPIKDIDVFVRAYITVAAGGIGGAQTLDDALLMMGDIELTLQNEKLGGDLKLIPRMSFRQWYRSLWAFQMRVQNPLFKISAPIDPVQLLGGLGAGGGTAFEWGLHFKIPFQFLFGESSEQDFGSFIPSSLDTNLILEMYPSQDVALNINSPFPGATAGTMTFTKNYIQVFVNAFQKNTVGIGNGKMLPVYQTKTLIVDEGLGIQDDLELKNWERGGKWHAIFINEIDYEKATGIGLFANSATGTTAGKATCMRDFAIYSNTDKIIEYNLEGECLKQVLNGEGAKGTYGKPLVLSMTPANSSFQLPNFASISSQKQINFQFDKVQNVAAGFQRYIVVTVLRYIPKNY